MMTGSMVAMWPFSARYVTQVCGEGRQKSLLTSGSLTNCHYRNTTTSTSNPTYVMRKGLRGACWRSPWWWTYHGSQVCPPTQYLFFAFYKKENHNHLPNQSHFFWSCLLFFQTTRLSRSHPRGLFELTGRTPAKTTDENHVDVCAKKNPHFYTDPYCD